MKKISIITTLVISSLTLTKLIAAPLLPHAKIYQIPRMPNDYPQITGQIINLTPENPLIATNEITVPNQFPDTVTKAADYTVSPKLTKEGYGQWTKSIEYADANGDGCYAQFEWNPSTGLPEVAVTPTNDHFDASNCSTGSGDSGINIVINNSKNAK